MCRHGVCLRASEDGQFFYARIVRLKGKTGLRVKIPLVFSDLGEAALLKFHLMSIHLQGVGLHLIDR